MKKLFIAGLICCGLVGLVGEGIAASQAPLNVNINVATVKALTAVKGIGLSRAKSIVAYRDKHGQFQRIDELVKIHGINQRFLQRVRAQLSVG